MKHEKAIFIKFFDRVDRIIDSFLFPSLGGSQIPRCSKKRQDNFFNKKPLRDKSAFKDCFVYLPFIFGFAFFCVALLKAQPLSQYQKTQLIRNLNVATSLYNQNNFELSIDFFQKALEIDPANTEARYLLGLAYYAAGHTDNAVFQWETLMKLKGRDSILEEKIELAYRLQASRKHLSQASKQQYSLLKRLNILSIPGERKGVRITLPTAIEVNKRGVITVMDGKTGSIIEINGNGVQVNDILGYYSQSFFITSAIQKPYEFIKLADDSFFISDYRADNVVRVSVDGQTLSVWGRSADDGIPFRGPKGMSFDGNGNLMVVNSGAGQVQVVNLDGELINTFGSSGSFEGEMKLPSDVYYNAFDKNIYVVDSGNKRLQRFDRYGVYIDDMDLMQLENPTRVAGTPQENGSLLLLDTKQLYRVDFSSKKIEPILADEAEEKKLPRYFLSFALNKAGQIYLGNAGAGTIDIYSPTAFLYENLKVHWQGVDLSRFPQVGVRVSVRNYNGDAVGGMGSDDFQIYENDVLRPLTRVKPTVWREKFRPVVLVEKSKVASDRQKKIENFIKSLFAKQEHIDSMQLIGYGSRSASGIDEMQKISSFTKLPKMATKKLLDAPFYRYHNAGSALQEAIALSLSHPYRKAIVMLVFSKYDSRSLGGNSYQSLIDYAVHNQVPLYVVDASLSMVDSVDGPVENLYLKNFVELTGGMYFSFGSGVDQAVVDEMVQHENGVYDFIYRTKKNPFSEGTFRRIEVRANFQGLSGVDDKGGYYIP